MKPTINRLQRDLARNLRSHMTLPEQQLWAALRKRQVEGFRFRRQMPLWRYIADFVCLEARLVIELDGNHHRDPEQYAYDRERDQWMQQQQFHVLRFWNEQIIQELDSVLHRIRQALYHSYINTSLSLPDVRNDGD